MKMMSITDGLVFQLGKKLKFRSIIMIIYSFNQHVELNTVDQSKYHVG